MTLKPESLRKIAERLPRWSITAGLSALWYAMLFTTDGYVRRHYDVFDPSEATHMGSDAVNFRYGFAFALGSIVPPLVAGLWRGREKSLLVACLVCLGLLTGISTLAFYASGAAGCDRLGLGPGQDAHFLVLVAATLAVPAVAAAATSGRASLPSTTLTLALVVGAASAFMIFLQAGHCANFSSKVVRESDALLWFPFTFAVAAGGATLGGFLSRRLASAR